MATFFDRSFVEKDAPRKKRNALYWSHAEKIWQLILNEFPETCNSIKKCLQKTDRKEHPITDNYDLVYGDVQSGKTRSIIILSWYCRYISVDIYPVILTINRGTVRQDLRGKMDDKGEINLIIRKYFQGCVEAEMVDSYVKCFSLNFIDFLSYRQNGYLSSSDVLVLIQNAANFKELITLYKTQSNLLSMCVIVDEIHKMYTTGPKDRLDGLTKLEGGNIEMMYWLHNEAKSRLYLIGVTATPLRTMVDIHLFPAETFRLKADPVGTMKYYGQFWDEKQPTGYIRPYSRESEIEAIDEIFNRDYNGYIRMVLINTKTTHIDHESLRREISFEFPNTEIWIINNEGDLTLSRHFDKLVEDVKDPAFQKRIIETGIVIIGQKSFDAGVSVKPPPGQRIRFKHEGVKYRIFGITDQIYSPYTKSGGKTLETNLQAMRLFGYYPEKYDLHLWIIEEHGTGLQFLRDQFSLNQELISRYDKNPRSLLSYIDKTGAEIFSKELLPFKTTKMYFQRESKLPEGVIASYHETKRHNIGALLEKQDLKSVGLSAEMKLSDLHRKLSLQHKLRALVEQEYKNLPLVGIEGQFGLEGRYFQIPYTHDRYKELCKAVVHPKEGEASKQWKVQYMLTGEEMEETRIKDLVLVHFVKPLFKDPKDGKTYYYQETDTKIIIVYPSKISVKEHEYADNIGKELSLTHYDLMKTMTQDKVVEEPTREGKCYAMTLKNLPCKRNGIYQTDKGMACCSHK